MIERFASNPIATRLLLVLLLGGGLISVANLSVQSWPDPKVPIVVTTVTYPGATPAEVDEEVNQRLVESIRDVEGVALVLSEAHEGLGVVFAELDDFVDEGEALSRVETAVGALRNFPPPMAERPTIALSPVQRSIATLAITSEVASELHLRQAAEALREDLLALPGVSLVALYGVRDYEVSIEVSEEALLRNNLTMDQVAQAVGMSSQDLAAGELRTGSGGLLVRADGRRDTGEEFEDVVILARSDGTLLRLGEIATVRDGFEDVELVSELDGKPAAFVRVWESSLGEPRIIESAADVLAVASEFGLPEGMQLTVWEDRTESVIGPLDLIARTAIVGLALVFLFLVAVFDLRLATWVALGIPVSFLGAFMLFDAFGVNINLMALYALFVVIGIVVDDAVVVGESIARAQEEMGPGIEAAVAGARAVAGPVIVGVLTTMLAFAPLFFLPGILAAIIGDFPIVVVLVLAVSLIEAFVLLPAHLAHGGRWSLEPLADIQSRVRDWLTRLRDGRVLRAVTVGVRRPGMTLGLSAVLLLVAALLPLTDAVDFVFLESIDETDRIQVDVTMPAGTPFAVTERTARSILAEARKMEQQTDRSLIRSAALSVGSQPKAFVENWAAIEGSLDTHKASVTVRFHDHVLDEIALGQLRELWRRNIGEVAGAERLEFYATALTLPRDIDYYLLLPSQDDLTDAAAEFEQAFRDSPALYGVVNSGLPGKRQFEVEINAIGQSAALTPAEVARQLRSSFFGIEVQRMQRGREEVKVMVRYPPERRRELGDLLDEQVSGGGVRMPLSMVAEVVESEAPQVISRYNGLLATQVMARVDSRIETPGQVSARLEQEVLPGLEERYPGLSYARAGQFRVIDDFASVLMVLAPVALLLIYGLVAVLLKSYLQPLLVLASMPFGVAGAIMGHALLGLDISTNSIFGMVAVCGVVVNDAVVLLDRYNKINAEGNLPAVAVAAAAVRHRFRAIFLTTASTLVGLAPMLYLTDAVGLALVALVVSLMAGLLVASAMLLFVVPALLLVIENARERFASGRSVQVGDSAVGVG